MHMHDSVLKNRVVPLRFEILLLFPLKEKLCRIGNKNKRINV
jgi:hypothetical protein